MQLWGADRQKKKSHAASVRALGAEELNLDAMQDPTLPSL
jgi:hypothetical protein